MVSNYQYADCNLEKKCIASFVIIFSALSFPTELLTCVRRFNCVIIVFCVHFRRLFVQHNIFVYYELSNGSCTQE